VTNSNYSWDQFTIIDQGMWQMLKEWNFYKIDWSAFNKKVVQRSAVASRFVKITLCLQFAKSLLSSTPFNNSMPFNFSHLQNPAKVDASAFNRVNWHLSYVQHSYLCSEEASTRWPSRSYLLIDCCAETPHLLVGPRVWLYLIQFTAVCIKIIYSQLSVAETPHLLVGPWVWLSLIQFNRQLL